MVMEVFHSELCEQTHNEMFKILDYYQWRSQSLKCARAQPGYNQHVRIAVGRHAFRTFRA